MQTRDMWKSGKWKLVAGAATLSALGISGLALADSDNPRVPAAITLQDQATTRGTLTTIPDFVVSSNNQVDLTDLGSPFDDDPAGTDIPVTGDTQANLDSPANPGPAGAADSPDSPTTTTGPAPAPLDDSLDSAASDGGAEDSDG